MPRALIGAGIGLIVGWLAGNLLQRAIDWAGLDSLAVILAVLLGALLGAGLTGFGGALAGAILGGILGLLAVSLTFFILKLAAIVVGVSMGWRWAAADD